MNDQNRSSKWYPEKICAWEKRHGICRWKRNGMLYIGTFDVNAACESMDRERMSRQLSETALEEYANRLDGTGA